ncbi:unnamed protein product [Rotaria socialis]|uniref:Uncharacterized protein n=1 Tax=Rotaria socialis TaxID=392032 RepID=A0A817PJT5_9BILA|nr:unnamed protein product [Rotaria socialis]CAF3369936.1 unnamed protein product [Rotaria socialis]CAF4370284.1 unnamed protein product [Rotaria socialis]
MACEESITTRIHHRAIPPIYLSYSNQTGFIERYFVVKLYEQLVGSGLGEGVIWFDHHQGIHPDKSATWFADRLEAIDLSIGSILILSNACQHQRLMTIESKAIADRKLLSGTSAVYGLFVILLDECHDFQYLRSRADFFYAFNKTDSISEVGERVSMILKELLTKLIPYKQFCSIQNNATMHEHKINEEPKQLCSWTAKDIQSFITRVGVQQSSRDIFAEKQIDGYLLLACTENELKDYFQMNNRKVRQMLIENVIQTIHRERQTLPQWHYEAKKTKGKNDYVYIIYDPEDHSIASEVSNFLKDKKFRVFTHNIRYGKNKHEFVALNGPVMARTKDVIFLLTAKSCRSTFTFHELTLAEWFEKPIVTVYLEHVWTNMRSSIRALLADYPSVDFIHQSLHESLTILHAYLRPQMLSSEEPDDYVQKLKQTIRPLASIATYNSNLKPKPSCSTNENGSANHRFVYLSYSKTSEKWNVIHAVERLIFVLEANHFHTGIATANTISNTDRGSDPLHLPKILSKPSSINPNDSYIHGFNPSSITTTTADIRRIMGPGDIRHCRVMIVCLTPKYFRNEHCLNELRLCEIYQKPILVVLLRHMKYYHANNISNTNVSLDEQINTFIPSKLPMTTLNFLRKNIRSSCIDLTTNELFSRNVPILLRRLEAMLGKHRNQVDGASHSVNPNNFSQASEVF